MSESTAGIARNLSDSTLTVKDGTGTPKTLLVAIDQGELEVDIKIKVGEVYARQNIKTVREGRKQMHDVTFTVGYDFLSADASQVVPSLYEALTGTGVAATNTWIGVDAANGSKYCTNLVLEIGAPAGPSPAGKAETLTLGKFFLESFKPKEGEFANMATVKGRCVTVTSIRH